MKLLDRYMVGGHYIRDKGDGFTRKHKAYRVLLIAYGLPVVVWAIAHAAVVGAAEVIGEVNQFIKHNN